MHRCNYRHVAESIARETDCVYGRSVIDGKWYVGTLEQVRAVATPERYWLQSRRTAPHDLQPGDKVNVIHWAKLDRAEVNGDRCTLHYRDDYGPQALVIHTSNWPSVLTGRHVCNPDRASL